MRLACEAVLFSWALNSVLLSHAPAADGPKVQRALPAGCQIGKSCEVTLSGTFATWPVQVWSDAAEINIRASETSGKLTVTVAENASPGLHFYRVFDANGASPQLPLIVDNCADTLEVEPNDHHRKAQLIDSLPMAVHGCLEKSGDVDTFQVSLKQGQTLVAVLDGQKIGSPMDADLQVLNSNGIILAQQLDHRGLDPELEFTAPADGNYQIRVVAFPDTPNSTIAYAGGEKFVYRLLLTVGPYVEFAVPAGLSTQRENTLELLGINLAPGTKVTLPPASPSTRELSFSSILGMVSLPATSGDLFVDTEPNNGPATEAKASKSGDKQPDGSPANQSITLPCIVTGKIDYAGDKDSFSFRSSKDSRWKIKVEAQALGSQLDAVLTLKNNDGKQLATNDDVGENRDPSLSWVTPADGDYLIAVHDMYRQGSKNHWYRIVIEPEQPDFSLTTTTDMFVGKLNQPIEIPVTIQRTLDLPGEIAIGLDTDLSGSRFEVISKKGDDSAKSVKLIIKSAEPFSGPIRIIGRSDNLTSQYARPAKHPNDWLWLTITP